MDLVWKILWITVAAYLAHHTIKAMNIVGFFVPHRHNHQPGPCRLIPGIEHGSEDIQLVSNGLALISAGWQTIEAKASEDLRGFYLFDFNQDEPDKNATKLTMTGGLDIKDLSPHGISLWTDSNTGRVTMFVVNHGSTSYGNESIEVFEFHEKTRSVNHLKTIRDAQFKRINDIVATSSATFYGTNDCTYSQSNLRWRVEAFLQTHFGNVVYYDGEKARVVASGYVLPNGINISPDGRTMYVLLSGENQMVVFDRHEDNSLTEVKRVDLYMSRPDNVDVQPDGSLWVAGSWKLLPDEHGRLSSMVLRAEVGPDHKFTLSEVYVNDGSVIGISSVAVYHKDQLLIGTPYSKLLYCEVKTF
ncbi:serum paraoxonase/arylesterase 2-like [Amphiura filiformis]|uniref:serum paraoxonase/arylesterase 2-like n=1 Tax=Amphiura filiformis TaxID=82378 RepID=UPI003B2210D1